MKKVILAFLVLATISCKKTLVPESVPSSSLENVQNMVLHRNTNFGVFINANFTPDKRASVANNLNAGYIRFSIAMDQWTGSSDQYDKYRSKGLRVIPNICASSTTGKPVPFTKNLTSYRSKFTSIVNKYQPEVMVVENEEINPHFHSGSLNDYISMLKVALDVCHAKGIKVTNGGIYGAGLEMATYRYLQTKGQKRADSFGHYCMESYQVKAAQNPNSNKDEERLIKQIDTLLKFYKNLDYVNIHTYEPANPKVADPSKVTTVTPVVVADVQEFLRAKTGRPTMTNETGQRNNTSTTLVTSMLQNFDHLNFPYALWISGSNDAMADGEPLCNNNTGSLLPNGVAYKNFMGTY